MNTSENARSSRDPYHAAGQGQGTALPPLELGASSGVDGHGAASGLLGALIEIVGVEGSPLHGALAAWQREQDRLANRAWRATRRDGAPRWPVAPG